jgi:D-lactate dehydrogenase
MVIKSGVIINTVFGKRSMTNLTNAIKKVIPSTALWTNQIISTPKLSVLKIKGSKKHDEYKIIYFPFCISRLLGTYEGKEKNIMEAFMIVCEKAHISVTILKNVNSNCLGQIYLSKGHQDAFQYTANAIVEKL